MDVAVVAGTVVVVTGTGAAVTLGVGSGTDNETKGSSTMFAGRTMCSSPEAAATIRDGVSS